MGCGSGIWGVDMAEYAPSILHNLGIKLTYRESSRCGPHSDILGMDLTLHQPML